jgi:hypothetical protein
MMTLTGGRVLFAGGRVGGADAPCVTDVELFEPATMAWRKLAPLPIAMCGGAGVELADGSIFVGIQLPGPQPRERSRDGSVAFVSYETTTNRWTQVASTAPPFNLSHLVPLRGREVLILGYDEVYALHAYTWSGTVFEPTIVPAQVTSFNLMTAVAEANKSVTWFLGDATVLKSATPGAQGADVAASKPHVGLRQAVALPNGRVIADAGRTMMLWDPALGAWQDVPPPPKRSVASAMVVALLADGRLLVSQSGFSETLTRLYSPGTRQWQRIASPHDVNRLFAALPDGRILAVNATGRTTVWSAEATMDLGWHRLAAVPQVLAGATVTPLVDGRLLVAGGNVGDYQTSSRAIVVDPETGAWTETGAMSRPRTKHTATLLADGRVLVAGGTDHNRIVDVSYRRSMTMPRPSDYDEGVIDHDSLEVWDPRTGAWSAAGRFPVPLTEQTAVALPDGRVAFVGGHARRRVPRRMAGGHWSIRYATWKFGGVLVWDPATERVTDINAAPRRDSVGALVLRDGRVLALGGLPEGDEPAPLDLLQALDPRTNGFATAGALRVPRASPLAVQFTDGTVLIAGGSAGASPALRRDGLPIEAWAPTGTTAPAVPEFDAPRDPQAARLLADGRVAIAACDRTILWTPATGSWARADDLPPDSAGCRIVARGASFLAITPEGCTYELGVSER